MVYLCIKSSIAIIWSRLKQKQVVTFVPRQLEYLSTLAIENFSQPLKQIIHKNVTIPGEDLNEFDIDLLVLSPLASKLVCIPGEKELPGENEGWWVNPDTFGEIDELWANEALTELIALKFCTWNWQKYQFIILVLKFLYFEDWSFWNGTDICLFMLCYIF